MRLPSDQWYTRHHEHLSTISRTREIKLLAHSSERVLLLTHSDGPQGASD